MSPKAEVQWLLSCQESEGHYALSQSLGLLV